MTFIEMISKVVEEGRKLGLTQDQIMAVDLGVVSINDGATRIEIMVDGRGRTTRREGRLYLDRMENAYKMGIVGRE